MLKKNFPFVHQLDSMQCGVACLQMVCKYYGKDFTSSELDDLCPASKEGVSMLSMKKAAEHIGFRTVCGKFGLKNLSKIQMPCILHWNQSHFVVLYKIKRHKRTMTFCVADPYKGKIEYKEEDMLDYWTCIRNEITEKGIAMLLFPTQMFLKIKITTRQKRQLGNFCSNIWLNTNGNWDKSLWAWPLVAFCRQFSPCSPKPLSTWAFMTIILTLSTWY